MQECAPRLLRTSEREQSAAPAAGARWQELVTPLLPKAAGECRLLCAQGERGELAILMSTSGSVLPGCNRTPH